MSLRQALKIPTKCALFFPCDGNTSIVPTKNIVSSKSDLAPGNAVCFPWGRDVLEAEIIALGGKYTRNIS